MPAYSLLVPNVWWLSYSVGIRTAFCAEAFGKAFLAFCIFALTHPKNVASKNNVYVAPLIGATVGDLIAVFAPLTQAGFNPARDFGPRIIPWLAGWKGIAFHGWWVYVMAPIIGAPIGAFVANKLLHGDG
jgi:glycerol uptake facilitator-like aquaporin